MDMRHSLHHSSAAASSNKLVTSVVHIAWQNSWGNFHVQVTFVGSFSDEQKSALLLASKALIYTPSNEHFGIVPLEAMSHGRPVIACNSGGPIETVVSERTGYLCDANPESFGEAMLKILVSHLPKLESAV